MKKQCVVLVFFIVALLLTFTAAPIAAQELRQNAPGVYPEATPATPDVRPEWGTQGPNIKEVMALSCMPLYSSTAYSYATMGSGSWQRYCTSGSCYFVCNVDVPSGAQIGALEIDGCDTNTAARILASLYKNGYGGGDNTWIVSASSVYTETPGCSTFFKKLTTPETIDNWKYSYHVLVLLGSNDTTTTFNAIRIYYQLQISPAPSTASFNDVPADHPFFQYIEALYASGITQGCPYPNFCPDMAVTRGQMAAFLARALGLYWSY